MMEMIRQGTEMFDLLIPFSALLISCATLVFSVLGMRKKANGERVETLHQKIERLEIELQESNREIKRLTNENINLLRRLFAAEGGGIGS
jgi:flagellar motor switch protein FliM